jgi:RNA recognition motif-containing protein
MKEIYVGNLRFDTTVDELRDLFASFGRVHSIDMFTEPEPGRPHGFAFVEMDDEDADTAIRELDGAEFLGRTLKVEETREQVAED